MKIKQNLMTANTINYPTYRALWHYKVPKVPSPKYYKTR